MTYPPGGTPDPYQPQQPYGQSHEPGSPYAAEPSSGQPYGDPMKGQPYGAPSSGQPYSPYGQPPPSYGAQPGYGQPYAPVAAPTNTMAILSLVFAFIFAPAAIVMGHVARKQIRQTGEQGEGLATAGLWLGYIFTGIGALICAVYVVAIIVAVGSSAS